MSGFSKQMIKRHYVLITSLAASIGLHGIGLYFLTTHPMMLHHSLRSLFGISIAAPEYLDNLDEESIAKTNHILEDAFEHILVFSSHMQLPFDLVELPRGVAIAPDEEATEPLHFVNQDREHFHFFPEDRTPLAVVDWDVDMPARDGELICLADKPLQLFDPYIQIASSIGSYDVGLISLPQDENTYIIDPMGVDASLYVAQEESETDALHITNPLIARSFPNRTPLEIDQKIVELDTSLGTHKLNEQVPFLAHPPLSKMHAPRIHIASVNEDFDDYLPSSLAATTEWNDDFDLDIVFLPHPEGKGYIFSLALTPNFDISQHSLKHDVIFILDRSVRKNRFDVFKRAVSKSLSCLQQGDSFNIYIIDKKMTRFHAKSLPVTQKTIRAAEYFLEKQGDDTLFSPGDIYSSLEKILPEIQGTDSIHSAILITDGVSRISTRKQAQVLKNWVEKNNGKLSIYTAAVGQKNDLLMLDLLSSISGGKLLWSDTHASFPRKVAKLVLDLRDPVASDLIVDALPMQSGTHITLTPAFFQSPVLFSHKPYVILGSIDRPGPFNLIIQGRHRDQWIAIKKEVSFIDGSKADRSLINQWTAQKAQRDYTKFLDDAKPVHLKEAKEILKRTRMEVAFE